MKVCLYLLILTWLILGCSQHQLVTHDGQRYEGGLVKYDYNSDTTGNKYFTIRHSDKVKYRFHGREVDYLVNSKGEKFIVRQITDTKPFVDYKVFVDGPVKV